MAEDGNLANIRELFRDLTGLQGSSQLSDANINDKINDYYQNRFPYDVDESVFDTTFTQELSATDSGTYEISDDILEIKQPIKVDGADQIFTNDINYFTEQFPGDFTGAYVVNNEGTGLAIGTSNKAAAQNTNAFIYNISGDAYKEAANTETLLSGDNIPQNKYGAWRLEIDTDGTVSIQEADDNATGYDTPGLAVQGLPNESNERAALGYITAVNTSSVFVPGTTELDASGVTSTFTDGWNSNRGTPSWVLYFNGELTVRKKADDWMELTAPATRKPTALASDSSVPENVRWWRAIAYGAAIDEMGDQKDSEVLKDLAVIFDRLVNSINQKYVRQKNKVREVKASI
jgi:hypothetical protein